MAARHRFSVVRPSILSGAMVPWLPVLVGIGVMTGFALYGLALQVGSGDPQFEVPVDVGALPAPSPEVGTAQPSLPPSPEPPSPEPPPPATEPPPHPPATGAPPAVTEPPADVIGAYHLVRSFEREFLAKVVIVNQSDHPQDWTVKLAYPDHVGDLANYWIDGGEQPAARTYEGRHIFTSAVPLGAGERVILKVQFSRTGENVAPTVCKVNGTHCIFP